MIIIASQKLLEEGIQLSMGQDSAVAPDAFYLKAKGDSEDTPVYIVLPYELVTITRGCNFIAIMGYQLEEIQNGKDHVFQVVQAKESTSTDVIIDGKVTTTHEYPTELSFKDYKLILNANAKPVIRKDKRAIVCGEDIAPEYEGTPAECYRCSI